MQVGDDNACERGHSCKEEAFEENLAGQPPVIGAERNLQRQFPRVNRDELIRRADSDRPAKEQCIHSSEHDRICAHANGHADG
jgi:hypothetical protein